MQKSAVSIDNSLIKLCTGSGAFNLYVSHNIYTSFESQRLCYHLVEFKNSKDSEYFLLNLKKMQLLELGCQMVISIDVSHDWIT